MDKNTNKRGLQMKDKMKQETGVNDYILKDNNNSILESVVKKLQVNNLTQLFTPTVVDLSVYEKYVHEEHLKQIVKLISPNGEVKAIRYDSTITMITSNLVKDQDRLFYIEPQFSYDSDNMKIQETIQLGVEFVISHPKVGINEKVESDKMLNFEKCMLLVKELSELICSDEYQIEVSHSKLVDILIKPITLDLKSENELKHYISRKNERKVLDVLKKNKVSKSEQDQLLNMIRIREPLITLKHKSNEINLPREVKTWVESIGTLNEKLDQSIMIDLTASDRLTYYQGNVFKVYDMASHKEIISGGEYYFEDYGLSGCGFSIKL